MTPDDTERPKPPAFQFYAAEFLADEKVMLMSGLHGLAQRGLYITLLCVCWREGSLPADPADLAAIAGLEPGSFEALWQRVEKCFYKAGSRLRNKRLDVERRKQEARHVALSAAGRRGGEALRRNDNKSQASARPEPGRPENEASSSLSSSSSSSLDQGQPLPDSSNPPRPADGGAGEQLALVVPSAPEPSDWMHAAWQAEFGNGSSRVKLTPKRRQKYRAMYSEQLASVPDPQLAWRVVLRAVHHNEHLMSQPAYHTPESLLLNAERRDRRVQEAAVAIEKSGRKNEKADEFASIVRARRGAVHGD